MLDNFGWGEGRTPTGTALNLMSNLTNPWGYPPPLGFQIYSYYDTNYTFYNYVLGPV
jgi:hypothetical protein